MITEIIHAIDCNPPTRGHRLIITDDLLTAVVQAKHHAKSRVEVIMIDLDSRTKKTHIFKKVRIIPYNKVNLSDEISAVIAGH